MRQFYTIPIVMDFEEREALANIITRVLETTSTIMSEKEIVVSNDLLHFLEEIKLQSN